MVYKRPHSQVTADLFATFVCVAPVGRTTFMLFFLYFTARQPHSCTPRTWTPILYTLYVHIFMRPALPVVMAFAIVVCSFAGRHLPLPFYDLNLSSVLLPRGRQL